MWAQVLVLNHTHLLCLKFINFVTRGGTFAPPKKLKTCLNQVCDNRGYYIIIDTRYVITHYMYILTPIHGIALSKCNAK